MSFHSYFHISYILAKVSNFDLGIQETSISSTMCQKIIRKLKVLHFRSVMIIIFFVGYLSLAISIVLKTSNLKVLTENLTNMSGSIFVLFKVSRFVASQNEILEIMKQLEEDFPSTLVQMVKYNTREHLQTFKIFQKMYLAGSFGFFLSYGITPTLEEQGSRAQRFPVDVWIPFDAFHPFVFESVYLLLAFVSLNIITLKIVTDNMIFGIMFITQKKFEILKADLIELESYLHSVRKEKFKSLIQRHAKLIETVEKFEKVTTPIFLYNFTESSFIICFIGFQVFTAKHMHEFINFTLMMFLVLIQVLLLCIGGQKIIDSSKEIAIAVYELNWYENMNNEERRSLMMIMIQSQKMCRLTAGKFAKISLKSFMMISKSAYSYFMLLKTIWS